MLALQEAREALAREVAKALGGTVTRNTELVPLVAAGGRRLAETIVAEQDQPQAATSSMDGYCLRSADTAGANVESAVILAIAGEQAAGTQISTLEPQTAQRIFTGGLLPHGADTVLIQEEAEVVEKTLRLTQEVPTGAWIRQKGKDFTKGETLLSEGQVLTPRALALAALANRSSVSVSERVQVAVLATGDELIAPASLASIPAHKVAASSRPALSVLLERLGAASSFLPIAPDDKQTIAKAISTATKSEANILLTCGGASVGDYDCLRPAIQLLCQIDSNLHWHEWFHKVAVRPGMPIFAGAIQRDKKTPLFVLGVPGNPVSSYVSCLLFLHPLLALIEGDSLPPLAFSLVRLAKPLAKQNGARHSFLRAQLESATSENGLPLVRVAEDQDSSLVKTLAQADYLVSRPPQHAAQPAGAIVEAINLENF